ncbi:GNAT family N-acetyltransferase [Chryseobacterium sp. T1]
MNFSIQTELENETVLLLPLKESDFEELYQAASDPKIWEQHPNPDRYKRDVFQTFFEGAILSKGAFKIIDKESGKVAGSSRYYDYNPEENSILMGYTFYTTEYWGTGINHRVKKLMMDYIFQFVDAVIFHIGAKNIRSQISIERLGAKKIKEQEVEYFGEPSRLNFIYQINKEDYNNR